MAPAGSPFSFSKIEAIRNWAWAAGSLPGNLLDERLPGGDRLVELLLGHEALADLEEDLRARGASSGFWATNALPGGAGLGVPLAAEVVGGDQELGVEDRALGVGRLRAVGELGQVALPGGDRLVELLLPLEDLADLERGRHRQLGQVASGLVGLGPEAVLLEERGEGLERLLALAPGEVRRADLVGGRHGPGMRRDRPRGTAAGRRRRGSGWCRRAGWECRRSTGSRPGRGARIACASPGESRRRPSSSRSRARSVQVSRAGRSWPAWRWASPRWNRAASRSAPLGILVR